MKMRLLTICFALILLFAEASAIAADTFNSNLYLGITSPAVKSLQQILNKDKDTHVALSGFGSKGNETEYFGSRTLLAVIKYKQKHFAELGLPSASSADGIVDLPMRILLNATLDVSASTSFQSSPKQSAQIPKVSGVLTTPQKPASPYGDYFSSSTLERLAPYLPQSFQGPHIYSASTSLQYKSFEEIAEAINTLYKTEFNLDLVSTSSLPAVVTYTMKANAISPQISIKQAPQNLTDIIIIRGTGFENKNSVYTTLGHIDNIVATGGVLSARLSDLPEFSSYSSVLQGRTASISVMIWVSNQNGISNVLGPYNIELK